MGHLTGLLTAERLRRGTRAGTRALTSRAQAILVPRWFCDGTRMRQLARNNQISVATGYGYLHEGIDVLAARAHDTTAVRVHPDILAALTAAGADLRTLGDLGCEGVADTVAVGFKRPKNSGRTLVQQQFNKAHNSLRAIGERGNSLLKMTFRALRNVSLDPWRIGKIVAAALVILHIEHDRTT